MDNATHCATCGRPFFLFASDCTTGYGEAPDGVRYCFPCCGDRDREAMKQDGRATLYFTESDAPTVTNWPGTLKFPARIIGRSRNNFGARRTDFRFTGPDGKEWGGRSVGEWSQVANVRRLKHA